MVRDEMALALAIIAVAAGKPVAEMFRSKFVTAWKPDASPVTEADRAAEALIVPLLTDGWPRVPIISEELFAAGCVPPISGRFFLVDPLDGTREFIAGRPEVTVNIAVVEEGRPVAGAVYAPLLERLWFGGSESRVVEIAPGTAFNGAAIGRRIAVREPPTKGLVGLTSRSHRDAATEAFLAKWPLAETRAVGSSLKFCLIAEGGADLYPRLSPTHEWDTAAGHAVLAAAGGDVLTPDGEPLRYGKAPQFLHAGFIAVGRLRLNARAPVPSG
jgi:3'(2'),5'-bisphosphate nucleotidase